MQLTAAAFDNFPDVQPNADLSGLILDSAYANGWNWKNGDILVIAQKVISKSENQFVNINEIQAGDLAKKYAKITGKDPGLIELILNESSKVLRARKGLMIVQHRLGFICANAGIDHSNVKGKYGKSEDWVVLLPKNPDNSAKVIREEIQKKTGKTLGVVIIDSHGRPWRRGVVGISIGASGVPVVIDRRGSRDRYGYELKATDIGALDELAATASILMGQADEGRPVVVIRGFPYPLQDSNFSEILRNESDDLFR